MSRASATLPTQIPAGTPAAPPPRRLPAPSNRDVKTFGRFLGACSALRHAGVTLLARPLCRDARLGSRALGTGAEVGGGGRGAGLRSSGVGPPRPARSAKRCESGEWVTERS